MNNLEDEWVLIQDDQMIKEGCILSFFLNMGDYVYELLDKKPDFCFFKNFSTYFYKKLVITLELLVFNWGNEY